MNNDSLLARFDALRAGSVARRLTFDRRARLAALTALSKAVLAHRAEILAALAADLGKSATEAELTELLPVLAEISHAKRHLRGWMRGRRVWPTFLMLGTTAALHPQPKGVVLVIAPWNFPMMLSLVPMISAVAAGNAVVVKPSEMTPATSALLGRIAACLPDLVTVVEGGADTAQALLALPFDHVFFTGSPAVGKLVMAAAAQHLTPVTLELGGKSPVVIGEGADLAAAARWVAWGKGLNAGQVCVAPDHVYVPEPLMEPMRAALRAAFAAGFGAERRDMARIVNAHHYDRLSGLVADALAKGAAVEALGADRPDQLSLAPRLITGVTPEMRLADQEIFGPLLPLIPYRDLAQVISAINAAPKPLTLYAFARDTALINRLRAETSSGSLAVNLTVLPFVHSNLPFGGVGNSGMGAGHGKAGFDAFSHAKPVLTNRFTLMPLLFPPYGARVRRLVQVLLRIIR